MRRQECLDYSRRALLGARAALALLVPPTSSVATLAGRRATVVQTPTANPIVAALPRAAVTRHYRR
jgi:hypothetical protein